MEGILIIIGIIVLFVFVFYYLDTENYENRYQKRMNHLKNKRKTTMDLDYMEHCELELKCHYDGGDRKEDTLKWARCSKCETICCKKCLVRWDDETRTLKERYSFQYEYENLCYRCHNEGIMDMLGNHYLGRKI